MLRASAVSPSQTGSGSFGGDPRHARVEIGENALRRLPAVPDRPDDEARAAHDVPHGIDPVEARPLVPEIRPDRAPAGHLEAFDAPEPRQILGLEAKGLDDEVGFLGMN